MALPGAVRARGCGANVALAKMQAANQARQNADRLRNQFLLRAKEILSQAEVDPLDADQDQERSHSLPRRRF